MDENPELSNFRKQWQEEVRNRGQGSGGHQHQQLPSQSQQRASFSHPFRRRLPSFNSTLPPRLTHSRHNSGDARPTHDESLVPSHPETDIEQEALSASASTGQKAPILHPDEFAADKGTPRTALEHYERAAEKESQGSLGESLSLYRKAFRMDAKVESKFREKHTRPAPVAGPSGSTGPSASTGTTSVSNPKAPSKTVNSGHHSSPALPPPGISSAKTGALIASFAGLRIQGAPLPKLPAAGGDATQEQKAANSSQGEKEEEPERGYSPLGSLPSELLFHILHFLAQADVATFVRLSLVCKALAHIVATEEAIWKEVCEGEQGFGGMLWDWKCNYLGEELEPEALAIDDEPELEEEEEEEGEKRPPPPISEDLLPDYRCSYRRMFMDRPRIRYNGIYISTCNYQRQGASSATSVSWNTPVHIVTYYRYLRFYPSGTVLSLLSTHEPTEVVRAFTKGYESGLNPWGKYVMRGRWRMDVHGNVEVETEGAGGKQYIYRMSLIIKSAGRSQRQNKLIWRGFWSWNRLTDDTGEFTLRNDKAFFFSRVGAYERGMGLI